jgi:murein DD-endopeptidase MepM/ murein hydrolase activator NlpD
MHWVKAGRWLQFFGAQGGPVSVIATVVWAMVATTVTAPAAVPVAMPVANVAKPVTPSVSNVAKPVIPFQVVTSFNPPAKPWAAGHRGVDLRASPGQAVYAAAHGVVLYASDLVDRPVISIRHGFVRTTYEPVTPVVAKGDQVVAGQLIGHVLDRHESCEGFCVHFGAIAGDEYLDPVRLLSWFGSPVLRPIW